MSTPNPLIPQGTFQAQANKGASNVRIAVATIVAIHVVFFGGLLLQGCKRDTKTASGVSSDTNASASNLTLPPIDSSSLYYTNASHLPADQAGTAASNTLAPSGAGFGAAPSDTLTSPTNLSREPARPSNLNFPGNPPTDQTASTPSTTTTTPGREYTIVRGDTFAKIASSNGTTVAAIRKANPTIDPAKLRPGMKIQVPAGTSSASGATPSSTAPAPGTGTSDTAAGSAPAGDTYTVKAGDTLTKVAKSHGVTVSQLRAANNFKTSGLKVGQKIKIPAPTAGGGTHETTKHKSTKANATNSLQNPAVR